MIGTLFSFLWFFYIARSFKFTNAPLLGRQPGVLPLVLFACGLLWAGLVGLRVFQWRNYPIGVLDFISLGSIFSDRIDDYSDYGKAFRGESDTLLGLIICSSFCFLWCRFPRSLSSRRNWSGTFWPSIPDIVARTIGWDSRDNREDRKSIEIFLTGLVVVVPLSIPPLIGLYALLSGHRARRLSYAWHQHPAVPCLVRPHFDLPVFRDQPNSLDIGALQR